MKRIVEYVWLDGYTPEPNLRSKIKIIDLNKSVSELNISDFPNWGFDGSSTKQAEGNFSDCYLKPVRFYATENYSDTIYVLCEVLDGNNQIHESNTRAKVGKEDTNFWVGLEQEYFIRSGHNKNILGFNSGTMIDPQGKYYCGVGGQMYGREVSSDHLNMCLKYKINIEGTNAEVAMGQWEYQIFEKGKLKGADDLWMSRYFLFLIAEKYGYQIELHPKPIQHGEWNGSGMHTNFSNEKMRNTGGEEYFNAIFRAFESRTKEHIENYGSDNHLRLTGKFETQSIDTFSWGFSDRGASIRVPKSVAETWVGYLEDRRPASHADPYRIVKVISDTLTLAEELNNTIHMMNVEVDVESIASKYGALSNDELLENYRKDEE
jgi:glutamine synthetase